MESRVRFSINVSMTEKEKMKFDSFVDSKGFHKGRFARIAILEKIDREIPESPSVPLSP